MPDRKVVTYQSKLWVGDLEKMTSSSELQENVLICVSPETREFILSMLSFYGYWPTRWRLDKDSPTGSVPQETITEFVDKAIQEVTNIMACETDLTLLAQNTGRIATAIEDWYDRQYIDFFDLKAALEAAGLGKWVNLLEVFEEFGDILGVIPDFNLRIPTDNLLNLITTQLWRKNLLAKVDDITAMMRAQVVSESGPSAPVIIDALTQLIPGWTVADLMLGDADELIQAIPAALITSLLGNYVTNRLDDIAEAIEAATVSADWEGLIQTLGDIEQNCSLCGSSSGCTCCAPTGDNPPGPVIQEGAGPPVGYEEYDGGITSLKCKMSNMFVDDLIYVIDLLIANDVANIASIGIGAMSSLWALVALLLASGPVAWGLAGLGVVLSLIGLFMVNTIDLDELRDFITDNRQDLVCALYESTDNMLGYENFRQVLENAGASASQILFLDTMNLIDAVGLIFYGPSSQIASIEERLSTFVSTTDCLACVQAGDFDWVLSPSGTIGVTSAEGTLGTGTITNDGSQFVLSSVERTNQAGTHVISMMISAYTQYLGTDPGLTSTLCETHSGRINRVDGPSTGWNAIVGRQCHPVNCGIAISSVPPPNAPGTIDNMVMVFYQRTAPFSLTFEVQLPPSSC